MESIKPEKLWNIFMPNQVLQETSIFLCGEILHSKRLVCVYGVCDKETDSPNVIGLKSNFNHRHEQSHSFSKKKSVWLEVWDSENEFVYPLQIRLRNSSDNILPSVCILFFPQDLISSFVMTKFQDIMEVKTQKNKEKLKNVEEEALAVVVKTLYKVLHNESEYTTKEKIKTFHCLPKARKFTTFLLIIPWILISILTYLGKSLKLCFRLKVFNSHTLYIISRPSICQHLQERFKLFCSAMKKQKHKSCVNYQDFLKCNAYCQQLFDTVIGILICFCIHYFLFPETLSEIILGWADDVAQILEGLVKAFMGAPAGLKLNSKLTKFMGVFFQYHIYLWTGYLNILKSLMPVLLWYWSLTGVLGVTCQLSLISDMVTALTLHIYCFYVYAARMFQLQLYALRSLWRLFRGKKWNVLRCRVDSAVYNTDQLFVGTLLFTVLLFLLPTTLVYYTVFTLLRIVVLIVQGLLLRLVSVLTSTPIFTIILRLFSPKLLSGSAVFQILYASDNLNSLILQMKMNQLPYKDLLQLSFPSSDETSSFNYTWKNLLSNLTTGKLVYPWVERNPN